MLLLCAAAPLVKAEGYQLPVMIDAGYQARLQNGRGWHGPEALLQFRFDKLFGNRDLALHHLAVGGFWETGFGYEPNPARLAVMAAMASAWTAAPRAARWTSRSPAPALFP